MTEKKTLTKEEKATRVRLSAEEKETIITFDETSEPATIFTYNSAWQKHLEKSLVLKPTENNGYGGKTYIIDKKRIKPPRTTKKLTAEAKERLATRLAESRKPSKSKISDNLHTVAKNPTRQATRKGKGIS